MQQFEYRTETIDADGLFIADHEDAKDYDGASFRRPVWRHIDQLGADGWELVSVIPTRDDDGDPSLTGFFKRPQPSPFVADPKAVSLSS